MRFVTCSTVLAIALLGSGIAGAGPALDEEKKPTPTTDPAVAPTTPAQPRAEWGVDIRLREVFVPQGIIQLFTERAAGGVQAFGYGVDLVRRRGNLELQLGFEFEYLNPQEGVYVNKGNNVANGDTADFILSPDHAGQKLGWFTIEFTFINHAPITKWLAFRYGGGAGIGIMSGKLLRYDVACVGATNDTLAPGCVPSDASVAANGGGHGTFGGNGTIQPDHAGDMEPGAYNIPPVFPVVNAIIGFQIRPISRAVINIEGGIRTAPFFGISAGYFFF